MLVKGTAVIVLPEFIKKRFQEAGYQKWLALLSPEVRSIFETSVYAVKWYDLQKFLVIPTERLCDVFYNSRIEGAFELGKFSADYGLNGIYKMFMRIGSPEFILQQAANILPKYYEPSKLEVGEIEKKRAVLRIVEFLEMHDMIEQRIAGWMTRGLEICGLKNIELKITASLLKGKSYTEFVLTWA